VSELELFVNVKVRVISKCQSQSYLQTSELESELFINVKVRVIYKRQS
jgi:hypothetical protein